MSVYNDTAYDEGVADHPPADRRNRGSTGCGWLELRPVNSGAGSTPDGYGLTAEPLVGTIGQPRALDAIAYELVVRRLASDAARLRAVAAMEGDVAESGEDEA